MTAQNFKNFHDADFQFPVALSTLKVIGVGEVAHSSAGLHQLNAEVLLKLLNLTKIEAIFFEAPFESVRRINKKISASEKIYQVDMAGLYWTWRSEENLKFFNELSELNKNRETKVELVGIDMRQPIFQLDYVNSFLARAAQNKTLLEKIIPKGITLEALIDIEKKITVGEVKVSKETLDFSLLEIAEAESIISRMQSADETEKNKLLFFCNQLKRWVRTYYFFGIENGYGDVFCERDLGMFEAIEYYKDDKTIAVWAHLAHLIADNLTALVDDETFQYGKFLGSLLKDKLGPGYDVIAILAQEVAVSDQTGASQTFQVTPNSLEHAFSLSGQEVAFIEMDRLSTNISYVADAEPSDSALKAAYIKIGTEGKKQFGYAALRKKSAAKKDF